MSQPPNYDRQFDFSDFSTNNPDDQQPGVQLDNEYNAIKTTLDAVLDNLELIQRDDGALKNNSVGIDQLKAEVTLTLNQADDWATLTVYAVNDAVYQGNKVYRCIVAHTSGVFATDLAAVKWQEILDFDQFISAASDEADDAAVSAAAALASQNAAAASETNAATSAASLSGTSSTTLTPAIATKVFTTQSGKSFNGQWCLAYSSSVPTVYMHGPCTYSGTTLTMSVDNIGTATSKSDWVIWVSGTRGAVGAPGAPGAGSGDMLAANNLSDVASASTSRTNLGVAIGSNVQAFSSLLTAHAALSATSGTIEKTGAATVGTYTVTAAGKALIDDADAAAQRTTLGLGTAAVLTAGTSANNAVQLDGSAKLPAVDGSALTNITAGAGRLLNVDFYTMTSKTFTVTIASPAVFTVTAATLPQNGAPVRLTTTGALPTGLAISTTYYVVESGVGGTTKFKLSATKGGSAINTSGSQSGTHTAASAPFLKATNNPTFITVEMVGGGGNGNANGGGGGGGAYAYKKITAASLSSSEATVVGNLVGGASTQFFGMTLGNGVSGSGNAGGDGGTKDSSGVADFTANGQNGGIGNGTNGGPGGVTPFGGPGNGSGAGGDSTTTAGSGGCVKISEYS